MRYRGKRLLCILLAFCLVLGMLPGVAGIARAAAEQGLPLDNDAQRGAAVSEESAEHSVFTEKDDAILEEDVFAKIEAVERSAAKRSPRGVASLTEQDYRELVPQVIEAVESSETYVPGTLQQNGDYLVWETTVGMPCCYDARMEARANRADAMPAQAEAEQEAQAMLEQVEALRGGKPGAVSIGLIQPYWDSADSYYDYKFCDYSPSYLRMWQSLSEATGATGLRFTMSYATVDAIAAVVSCCGLVLIDSHGTTDYNGPNGDDTSRANCSYLCIKTSSGITSEDTKARTGEFGTYYDAVKGKSYTIISGQCIANHMPQDAPNSLVYLGMCLGMATDGLEKPLRQRGVEVVYGYSQSVSFRGECQYMQSILGSVKDGYLFSDAVRLAKLIYGDWDGGGSSSGYAEAVAGHKAFPIVVSDEDPYPGHGNVDALQTVNSTWSLFGSRAIDAFPDDPMHGTVNVSGYWVSVEPAAGWEVSGYDLVEGSASVAWAGNNFHLQPASDCAIRILFSAKAPASVSLASAGRVYSVESCYIGDSYVLPSTAPDYPNMELLGWSYVPVAYTDERPAFLKPGTELPITGDLLLHAVYAQIDGNLEDSFALVSNARTDWTGDWVITYGKNAPSFVLAGVHNVIYEHASSGGAVSFADSGMSAGAEYLAGVDARYVFRIEARDGKYTVQSLSTGDYVYVENGSSAAYLGSHDVYDGETSLWTVEITADGKALLLNDVNPRYPCIRFDKHDNTFVIESASKSPNLYLWERAEIGAGHYTTGGGEAVLGDWMALQRELYRTPNGGTVTLEKNITAAFGDSALRIPAGRTVTLALNGHTLDRALTEPAAHGCGIEVLGNLTLVGGTITGGNTTGSGGGVFVEESGSLVIDGTVVTGNAAAQGGGVAASGALTLRACEIRDNSGSDVFLGDNTVELAGGTAPIQIGALTLSGQTQGAIHVTAAPASGTAIGVAVTDPSTLPLTLSMGLSSFGYADIFTSLDGESKVREGDDGEAELADRKHTLTLVSEGPGTISGDAGIVYEGETVTVQVQPDEDCLIERLTVTGTNGFLIRYVFESGVCTFPMPHRDATVSVTFRTLQSNWVEVDGTQFSPEQGEASVNGSGSERFLEGQNVTVTATPRGSRVTVGWSVRMRGAQTNEYSFAVPNVSHPDPNTIAFPMPSQDVLVYPIFSGENQLLVFPCDMTGGTVVPDRSLVDLYSGDKTVTLTIQPDYGYVYRPGSLRILAVDETGQEDITGSWMVEELTQDSVYTVLLEQKNVHVSAAFDKLPEQPKYYVLIDSETENGTLSAALQFAEAGQEVTVTAAPDAHRGYALKVMTVTDEAGNAYPVRALGNGLYAFTMPAADVLVSAEFAIPVYGISVNNPTYAVTGCTVDAPQEAECGETVLFTVNLRPERTTLSLTLTGALTGTAYDIALRSHNDGSSVYYYGFTMPDEPVTITAVFDAVLYTLSVDPSIEGTLGLACNDVGLSEPYQAARYEQITVTYTPPEGKVLTRLWYSFEQDGEERTVYLLTEQQGGIYTAGFDMPGHDVTLHTEVRTRWSVLQSELNRLSGSETITLDADVFAFPGESALLVPSGRTVTIDLNGHTLSRNLDAAAENGCVIRNNGSLTLCDSSPRELGIVTGGFNTGSGGAVTNNGSLRIEGGNYLENRAMEAGAVFNAVGASLTVTGGVFSGNSVSTYGGGAFVNYGTMTFSGAMVVRNTAPGNGGGIWNGGTLTVTGGQISANRVTGSNSHGGGIYCKDTGQLLLSGSPVVTGNTMSGGRANNVHLLNGVVIRIDGKLSSGALLGVSSENPASVRPITSELYGSGSEASFTSDDEDFKVLRNSDGEAVLSRLYTVSVCAEPSGENLVAADRQTAAEGETVTLTLTPAAGYRVERVVVRGDSEQELLPDDGVYRFPMPAADVTVTASFAAAPFFLAHSLSLKGDIGVNFYLDLNGTSRDDYSVTFTWGDKQSQAVPLSSITPAADGSCKLTAGVAAKEMTDTVTATIYYGNTAIATNEYSVKEYCDAILADTTSGYPDSLKTLVRSMLIYGAKAQAQFENYNSANPADEGLTYTLEQIPDDTLPTYYEALAVDLSEFGLEFTSSSLVLDSKTSHRLRFTVMDGDKLAATTIRCGSQTLEKKQDASGFYVDIPNMAAKNVLKNYTVTFVQDGKPDAKLRVNAGAYIGIVLNENLTSESLGLNDDQRNTLKNTVKALYWYSAAAEAYFG